MRTLLLLCLATLVPACGADDDDDATGDGDADADADTDSDADADTDADGDADGDGDADADADADEDADADADADGDADACAGRNEAECLGSWPDCVATYDDACCPDCGNKGLCADCQDWQFERCDARADRCEGDPIGCGTTPDYACEGTLADCSAREPGTCQFEVGCIDAVPCTTCKGMAAECHPVTADACSATCEREPPACPEGTVPEGQGDCYSDYCIPARVCE